MKVCGRTGARTSDPLDSQSDSLQTALGSPAGVIVEESSTRMWQKKFKQKKRYGGYLMIEDKFSTVLHKNVCCGCTRLFYCQSTHNMLYGKWNLVVSMTYLKPLAIWNTNRFTEVNICKVLKRERRSWFHTLCSIEPLFSWSSCPSWLC